MGVCESREPNDDDTSLTLEFTTLSSCQLAGGGEVVKKQGGHSCKIGNMRPPGTLENQNPQFEKIFKFGLLFV